MLRNECEPNVLESKNASTNNSDTNKGHEDSKDCTKTRNKLVL